VLVATARNKKLSYDLVIRNGMVVLPAGLVPTDIGVRDGRIVEIGSIATGQGGQEIDATGLTVLPGMIDTQVHFREPGGEHKEDLATGSEAAVMGGITGVFEMPNTNPSTSTPEAVNDKLTRAKGRMWCEHAFYVGATPDNIKDLPELERMPGTAGVKMFMGSSTGSLLVEEPGAIEQVLANGSRRIAVHAEDEARLRERKHLADEAANPTAHPHWRDATTALNATKQVVELARKTGRRVHVLHISTGDEMDFLAHHKDIATVEITPNHITLEAPDCYERLGSLAQMNPPVRDGSHRRRIWAAVANGIVDILGSDHAPHTVEEKANTYPNTPSGMPGVQTTLPLMLNHVNEGRLSLLRLVDMMAGGPNRAFGIANKGRIAIGYDADFTLVDMNAERTIAKPWLASRAGWSPYEGAACKGWPVGTIIRGNVVMRDGELVGTPQGAPLRFHETLGAAAR
jgi:dihydroorotase